MGIPAVVVDSGGLPVTESTNGYGLSMTTVTTAVGGTAITIIGSGGLPVILSSFAAASQTAFLDFVNADYTVNGSTVAIASVLGGAFVAGDIVASGMKVWHANSNRPNAIGVLFDLIEAGMATGMTVVFEIDWDGASSSGLLSICDPPDFNTANFFFESYVGDDFDDILTMMDTGGGGGGGDLAIAEQAAFLPEWNATGINRIGMTLSRNIGGGQYRYAGAVNGQTAVSQDVGYSMETNFPSIAKIAIGHIDDFSIAYDASYIRSIAFYPAVDETTLAALTA